LPKVEQDRELSRHQGDWAARVELNGKVSGVFTDYHYYGTGDIGGTPDEESVKRLKPSSPRERRVCRRRPILFSPGSFRMPQGPAVKVGDGPVHVISANAEQMFLDITPAEAAGLPRYTGEMELTNHSAGSLTSQAYQKRWLRKEELLADAAEKASIAAEWLGARPYPLQRLNDAWTLVMGGHFHDIAAGTATPKAYEFAWNDDVIAMNQFAGVLTNATEGVSRRWIRRRKACRCCLQSAEHRARRSGGGERELSRRHAAIGARDRPGWQRSSGADFEWEGDLPGQGAIGRLCGLRCAAGSPGRCTADRAACFGELAREPYYRVKLNADGDVASIFDKSIGKELLAAPARLAISYDNPSSGRPGTWIGIRSKLRRKHTSAVRRAIRVVENGPGARGRGSFARNRRVEIRPDHPLIGRRCGEARGVCQRDRLEYERVESESDLPADGFQ
jgi:alpha-mannosidase